MRLDFYDRNCPSRQLLDRIGDTWSALIVGALAHGPRRYTELARRIDGISPKMLTQTLRGLERDGLLSRTVHAAVPPRVDYELTELGRSLLRLVQALGQWAEEHIGEVLAARASYDGQEGTVPPAGGDGAAGRPAGPRAGDRALAALRPGGRGGQA